MPAESARDVAFAVVLAIFVFLQALMMATQTPVGHPPDELAHLGYINDVISSNGLSLLPDYAAGTILNSRDANYLTHPPLYYTMLGLVGRALSLDASDHVVVFRGISAGFMSAGFLFFILAARRWRIEWPVIVILTVALAAVPMFSYLAGSVNNDTLLYLGVAMALYGVSTSGISEQNHVRTRSGGVAFLFAGTSIAVLTKATGIIFLLSFFIAYIALERRKLLSVLQERSVQLGIFSLFLLAGGYFLFAWVFFGALFPAPGGLYEGRVVEDPMSFLGYTGEFFRILWERLPIIMAHLNFKPIPERILPLFYLMVTLPPAAWLVVRLVPKLRRTDRGPIIIADAVMIAVIPFILVHALVGFRGYLETGLLAGLQPRYYVYLLPLLWMLFFAISRPGFFRLSVTGVFGFAALVVFWASVPFIQVKQYEALFERSTPTVLSDTRGGRERYVSLPVRESVTGTVDVLTLEVGTLFARGWVFDRERRKSVRQVWILDRGRYVGATPARSLREDVERAYSDPLGRNSGFTIRILNLPEDARLCDITVLTEYEDGTFGELHAGDCTKR